MSSDDSERDYWSERASRLRNFSKGFLKGAVLGGAGAGFVGLLVTPASVTNFLNQSLHKHTVRILSQANAHDLLSKLENSLHALQIPLRSRSRLSLFKFASRFTLVGGILAGSFTGSYRVLRNDHKFSERNAVLLSGVVSGGLSGYTHAFITSSMPISGRIMISYIFTTTVVGSGFLLFRGIKNSLAENYYLTQWNAEDYDPAKAPTLESYPTFFQPIISSVFPFLDDFFQRMLENRKSTHDSRIRRIQQRREAMHSKDFNVSPQLE